MGFIKTSLCYHMLNVIKQSTVDGGCTDFTRVLKPKIENGDLMGYNGDPMGEKGPYGDQSIKPLMG